MSQFHNPVKVYFGAESVGRLAADMADRYSGISRVLVLTRGGGVERSSALRGLLSALRNKELLVKELQLTNPNLADIAKLRRDIDHFEFGLIIAIGGGSVMDAAKMLAALHPFKLETASDIRVAVTGKSYREQESMTPWIGIPTTSGTGSEVTSWATLWDEELGCKYSLTDERLYASGAMILPELTVSMPLRLSAATALDAMSHATEAYWSIHTNPITQVYALQAVERIRNYLPQLKDDPGNMDIRTQLSLASLYAGLAFSNTRTTACHSISYPLTLQHGIEHGVAVSLTIAEVLRLNLAVMKEPAKLLQAFGAESPEAVHDFIIGIFKLYDIPGRLSMYGADVDSIPAIVERAYTKGRMDNNPVPISRRQVQDILLSLL